MGSITLHHPPSASISIHDQPSPSITIHQHPSTSISIHQHPSPTISIHQHPSAPISIHQHPSASISNHQHPPASTSIHQHPPASTSIHQHPSTTPPPAAFTMSPGSHSSPLEPSPTDTQPPFEGCSSTDGGEDYDELPLPTTRGTFTACSNSGATTNSAAVLTSRSASPTTAKSAGNQRSDTISRSQEGATSELLKSPGQFLIRLILLLITSSFPLNPGALDVSHHPMESLSNLLRPAPLGTMTLPSGPSEFGSFLRHATL